MSAVVLLAVLGGLTTLGASRITSVPNVFGPIQWASNETHPRWVVSRPVMYPDVEQLPRKDIEQRKEFYISEAMVMASCCMALVVATPLLLERLGAPRHRLKLPEVTPLQLPWLVASEVIDSAAVAAAAIAHGVFPRFGLYWEDWVTLYSLLLSSILAQLAFGAVPPDNAGLAMFPPTSARLLRMKDKVQVALLVSQGPVGALLAASALVISVGTPALMLRYFPDDYVPAFFVVSVSAEARILDRGTWHDWAMEKLEVQTRDGKVVHAATHDLGISFVTVGLWLLCGGTPFVVLSLEITAARVMLLPLGRLLVLQRLDEWGKLYLLRARLYGWAAAACCCSRSRRAF